MVQNVQNFVGIFRYHLTWTRTLRTKALGVSKWESCLSVNWSISSQCIPIPALYISPLFSLSIYSTLHSQGTVQENQYVGMTNKTLGLSWKLTYPNSLSGFSCKSFIFSSLSHWTIDKNDWGWALIVCEKKNLNHFLTERVSNSVSRSSTKASIKARDSPWSRELWSELIQLRWWVAFFKNQDDTQIVVEDQSRIQIWETKFQREFERANETLLPEGVH